MNIQTTKGILDTKDLEVKDVISMEEGSRIIATEWFFNKELVRRDVNVNILIGLSLDGEQSQI